MNFIENFLRKKSYSDVQNHFLSRWTKESHHIFIACLPKSGSTFIADVLKNITNFEKIQFQPIRGTNDHNIDSNTFLEHLNVNTVTQLHTKANDHNLKVLKDFEIKVVYLCRNILDSLKSFHFHILNENDRWFMFTKAENYKTWENKKQFDFLIDLVLPWYLNFLTSWEDELKKGDLEILKISFEEFNSDNYKSIERILNFYNLDFSEDSIKKGLQLSYDKKYELRYIDRKQKIDYKFSNDQVKRIQSLLDYYPDHNISL